METISIWRVRGSAPIKNQAMPRRAAWFSQTCLVPAHGILEAVETGSCVIARMVG